MLRCALLLVSILVAGCGPSPHLSGQSSNEAQARIAHAFEIHGTSPDREAVAVTLTRALRNSSQSVVPGDTLENSLTFAYTFDLAHNRAHLNWWLPYPGGFTFDFVAATDGEHHWEADRLQWRQGTDLILHDSSGAAATRETWERVLPTLALQQAHAAPDLTLAEDGTIRYTDTAGQAITLRFDEAGRLSELTQPSGEQTTDVHYVYDANGTPQRVTQTTNGSTQDWQVTSQVSDPAFTADLFDPPPGYASHALPSDPEFETLADGAHLLVGLPRDYRSLVIEQPDGLVVLEAPVGSAYTRPQLDLIRERWPDTPIQAVGVSHHHGDHIGGLATMLAATGAPIVAGPDMAAYLGRILPDSLDAEVIEVKTRHTIGEGQSRVEVHAVPNSHAASLVMFYLPAHRLVFQGDLLGLPYRGEPIVSATATAEMMAYIEAEGLDVERIVAVHGGRTATLNDVRRVLAQPRQ